MAAHQFLAHSTPANGGAPEPLSLHLSRVAAKARQLAGKCAPTEAEFANEAEFAGLLHDLGKYQDAFQEYLAGHSPSTPHAIHGAVTARQLKSLSSAFCIAGHHAGLHDLVDLRDALDRAQAYPVLLERFAADGLNVPERGNPKVGRARLREEMRLRMLFSVLVEADRLMTAFHETGKVREECRLQPDLLERLLLEQQRLSTSRKLSDPLLLAIRRHIFEACLAKAALRPGPFSLTVPTGGGKTLSAMAFALAHALAHGLHRVVVVIPFLSIIEQNAAVYASVLGPENVVEHHSNVEPRDDVDAESAEAGWLQAGIESWDAPVVVTTTVQFVETLFARSPTRCRRLHNLARSVVVLDEAQTLPAPMLTPIADALRALSEDWGTSWLFCSATQPGLRRSRGLPTGFAPEEIREIAPEPARAFKALRRVDYRIDPPQRRTNWEEIAEEMARLPQVLCVVNSVRHAAELWETLRTKLKAEDLNGLFHLSARLCPQHRLDRLGQPSDPGTIRGALAADRPCRLVSTQLVEAGVDLDFPVVLRALAPLDSIVQAAGRCNREGSLVGPDGSPVRGQVRVFRPADGGGPSGTYRTATDCAAALLERIATDELAEDPSLFPRYFEQLFGLVNTDQPAKGENPLQVDREKLQFATVARNARVIKDDTVPVVVPYLAARERVEHLRTKGWANRDELRGLQRFIVSLRPQDQKQGLAAGVLERLLPELELYWVPDEHQYSSHLGLQFQQVNPMEMVI